jgi:hypothetical protein
MQWNRRAFFLAGLASRLAARQRSAVPLLDRGFATVSELAPRVYEPARHLAAASAVQGHEFDCEVR